MISIIIPVYNVEEYLHICLNSILKQTYRDLEVICIDDASTDSSLEILQYFAKKDSRIKIIKNDINLGPGQSRNLGIESAKGKYILFLDSDDWYSLDTLETLFNEAEKNNLEVLMFRNIVYYEDIQNFGMEDYYDMEFMEKFNHKLFNHWDIDKTMLFKVPIGVWNKLYLKSFLEKENIRFPDENLIHEDNPFSCKVILKAEKISLITNYLYNRRRRPGSIMTLNNERLFDTIPIVRLILEAFLENKELYNYYKKEVLTYIFEDMLNSKYFKIDEKYQKDFFVKIQGVYREFIKEYGLYKDIKENVPEKFLNRFEFDEIVENLLKSSPKV